MNILFELRVSVSCYNYSCIASLAVLYDLATLGIVDLSWNDPRWRSAISNKRRIWFLRSGIISIVLDQHWYRLPYILFYVYKSFIIWWCSHIFTSSIVVQHRFCVQHYLQIEPIWQHCKSIDCHTSSNSTLIDQWKGTKYCQPRIKRYRCNENKGLPRIISTVISVA